MATAAPAPSGQADNVSALQQLLNIIIAQNQPATSVQLPNQAPVAATPAQSANTQAKADAANQNSPVSIQNPANSVTKAIANMGQLIPSGSGGGSSSSSSKGSGAEAITNLLSLLQGGSSSGSSSSGSSSSSSSSSSGGGGSNILGDIASGIGAIFSFL